MSIPDLVPVLAARLASLEGLTPMGSGPPTPEDMARFAAFGAPVDDYRPPEVDVQTLAVDGPHGPVPVRVYRPTGATGLRGLVWAHGGAFLGGDLDMPEADVVGRELAARGVTVVSVDYRLCQGGVHFPVPHDDVHAAYSWAAGPDGLLGGGSAWAIGGASAGGNLAAGVAQRLRDEGGVAADAVVLAYPVLHDPVPEASAETKERVASLPAVLRFSPEATAFLNRNFLGDNPPDTPYAFPGHGDVAGLARTLVVLCEYDDLRPSGEAYAAQLRAADVPVDVEVVHRVPHGHLNVVGLREARTTIDGIASFLGAPG